MFFDLIIKRVKCFCFFFFRKPLTPPSVYLQNFCQTCKLAQQLFHRNSSQLILSYILSQAHAHQIKRSRKKTLKGLIPSIRKVIPAGRQPKSWIFVNQRGFLDILRNQVKSGRKKNYVDGRICRNCYSTGLMCKVIYSK